MIDKNEVYYNLSPTRSRLSQSELNTSRMLREDNFLDQILESSYIEWEHVKVIITLILYVTGEGFVMIGISLLIPVISTPWRMSDVEKGLTGGSVFFGFTFGALVAGLLSDKHGRRFAFRIGSLISTIGALFGYFFYDRIDYFILSNTIIGFGIGISIPSIISLVSEITNTSVRSYIIGWVWNFFVVGEVIGCLIAMKYQMYFYENFNWRKLLLFRSLMVMRFIIFSLF